MLVEPKDGHVWQSKADALAPASQGGVVRQGTVHRHVCDEAAGDIFCSSEQK
jgi:hypothetical protein